MKTSNNTRWWVGRLLPLFIWIVFILWVATRPKTTFFAPDVKTFLGMPREWLQYPYHFGAFFILAILFRRCFSEGAKRIQGWRVAAFSLVGCATVSVTSELLQIYVPTRSPALRDLAVDQSGAMLALTLMRNFAGKLFRLG
jgi:hypothetical protein